MRKDDKKMKAYVLRLVPALVLILAFVLVSCTSGAGKREKTYRLNDFVMSTVLSVTLYGSKDHCEEVHTLLDNLEKKELSWREPASELAGVNKRIRSGKECGLTPDFAGWMEKSKDLAGQSGGAFDPTIGSLIDLWNIEGENPAIPPQEEITLLIEETGYEKIHLKDGKLSIAGKAKFDLGAVGKGIGADEVLKYLKSRSDISAGIVAIGGTVLTYGSKPDAKPWQVAIQDPRAQDGTPMGVLEIDRTTCVSTSGDYEKYFEENGKRYHHILNPQTGWPADNGLISVTVVCDDGLLSDGLSTACFVAGRKKGMEILKKYEAEGIFIDKNKNVYVTDGLKDNFSLLNEDYKTEGADKKY